ncbi:MAG: TIGR03545 family protein [Gemmatimonadaceae bacterium]|nr:TIGR03545 family protein [Gemmatimonadaceae bacterium]
MKYIRWKALLPLSVTLLLIAVLTYLFKDKAVEWTVERGGTAAVGGRVDLASASVSLGEGSVTLRGLDVTNPNKPMTNLVSAEELVLDIGLLPALERKVVIDTMAARGIRFNTPRETSGAIPRDPNAKPDEPSQVVEDFKRGIKIPPLELSTLTKSVNVAGISAESLATLREARHAQAYADTARDKLLADLRAADPRPAIDSAEALARRLGSANLRTLGIAGARQAVTDVRRTLRDLEQIDDRLRQFEAETRGNAAGLQDRVNAISAARTQDYAYARSLLQLPSFDLPSIGPQLFSDLIAEQLGDVMYWVAKAEQYLPPGLERQFQPGPKRVRASGTDVIFPKATVYPQFLLRLAELSLAVGGTGASAGDYDARIVGLTSEPSVYGAPTTFSVNRAAGQRGPSDVGVVGMFDHRQQPVRDTVAARFRGITLPTFPLGGLGGAVQLNAGLSDLVIRRTGDALDGRWLWRAPKVTWVRDTTRPAAADAKIRIVEDALWRALGRIDSVEIEARIGGTMRNPTLGVRTNIANAVGNALRDQLGDEVRRAEQQVRQRVDQLVDSKVAEARAAADQARSQVSSRIAEERQRLETQKQALEARLRELTRIPGIGSL